MCLKHANRLARLHQHGFVVFEVREGLDHGVKGIPVSSRFTRASVDNELLRVLCNRWVKVVVQHADRRFLLPTLGRDGRTGRCVQWVMCVIAHENHPRVLADYFL